MSNKLKEKTHLIVKDLKKYNTSLANHYFTTFENTAKKLETLKSSQEKKLR